MNVKKEKECSSAMCVNGREISIPQIILNKLFLQSPGPHTPLMLTHRDMVVYLFIYQTLLRLPLSRLCLKFQPI